MIESVSRGCTLLAVAAMVVAAGCGSKPPGKVEVQVERAAPATCADIVDYVPGAVDGTYVLYAGHDWAKPWLVDCVDMATTTAREYLPVIGTSLTGLANYSQYTADAAQAPGTNVQTRFTKVRIDPATFVVETRDLRFATSTGSLTRDGTVTRMAYASAADCACGAAGTGVGNVDLTGTPFAVQRDAFIVIGWEQVGTIAYGSDDRVVSLTGGGCCGSTVTVGAPGPANATGSGALPLVYVGW